MTIFDEIAKGGNAQPIAAFLVGREQKLARERQQQIDELNAESTGVVNELRRAQTDNLRKPVAPKVSARQFREGDEFVTRRVINGLPDMSDDGVLARSTIKSPTTNFTVNQPPIEKAADKKFGEGVGERASKRIQEAQVSAQANADLDRMLLALDRGAQTGFGEELILNIKSLGNTAFGLEFDESDSEAEIIRKLSNEMALRLRNPDSGLGLTGSTSNKDLDFLKASVPGLQRTEGGNLKIIDYAKRVNKLKSDAAAYQAQLIQQSGGVPQDLDAKVMDFVNNYELFSAAERAELQKVSASNKSVVDRLSLSDEDNAVLDDILSR